MRTRSRQQIQIQIQNILDNTALVKHLPILHILVAGASSEAVSTSSPPAPLTAPPPRATHSERRTCCGAPWARAPPSVRERGVRGCRTRTCAGCRGLRRSAHARARARAGAISVSRRAAPGAGERAPLLPAAGRGARRGMEPAGGGDAVVPTSGGGATPTRRSYSPGAVFPSAWRAAPRSSAVRARSSAPAARFFVRCARCPTSLLRV